MATTPNAEGCDNYRPRAPSPGRVKTLDDDVEVHLGMGPHHQPVRSRVSTVIPVGQPLFAAYPPRVQFMEYTAFEPVSIVVRLRNHDTVARRVRVVPPESTWFSVSPFLNSGKRASKVAPGIEVKFRVTFTAADEHTDYSCQIIVVTEREQFELAVEAQGRPAQLDFPDVVRFEAVPANHVTMQPHLLRNVGRNEVAWEMRLPVGSPFRVVPAQGVLVPDQHAQVQVEIVAGSYLGDVQGELDLVYDKGRQHKIVQICATVQDVDISLDSDQVDLPPASIHLCTVSSFRLFNDSDIPVTYTWMQAADPGGAQVDGHNRPGEAAAPTEPVLFQDAHFAIEPLQGELYPGGFIEFTASFRPSASDTYMTWAYCNVGGRSRRLPLRLTGKGIGPTALLSYDTLDIGDVYINAVYRYEAVLKNVGQIQARFSLSEPNKSERFACDPPSGVLESGESRTMAITFSSALLGTFHEVLTWTLLGSVTPITLTISGNVVAPTFEADCERLDFGLVAFGFVTTRSFTLRNTCEIPIRLLLRCPQDGKFLQREIDIRPSVVAVLPQQSVQVEVDLCSETVQVYNLHQICIDIENVGTDLLRIPLEAVCQVPDIEFGAERIEFGRCYLRYAYGQVLELSNRSDLAVRFEIITDLTMYRKGQGRLRFDAESATILPHSTFPLKIALFAESLGEIDVGIYIRTCGSSAAPFQLSITGCGIGPQLVLSRTQLDFRQVPVLQPVSLRFTMRNETPIEARFVAFAARRYSNYVATPREGTIAPGHQLEVTVQLTCNDNALFRDVIHILVEEGDPCQVQCRALGQGSTITCTDTDLAASIDLGYQMSVQKVTRTFTLRNDGVRAQTLTWRYDGTEAAPLFQIRPEKVTLGAAQSVQFTVEGSSPVPRTVNESWTCLGLYASDKEAHAVAGTRLLAAFVHPHVEFSVPALQFDYRHDIGQTVRALSKTTVLRNVTPLPVSFVIGVKQPFTVDRLEVVLAPGQQVPVEVTVPIGPAQPGVSESFQGQLVVAYVNHPGRDRIPLSAQLWYPNLSWSQTMIDFGTILNNTVSVKRVVATNPTVLAADFSWSFVVDPEIADDVAQVMDVQPLFGRIEPGVSCTFDFTFFGRPDRQLRVDAVCSVTGGPDYTLTLHGAASTIQYVSDLGPTDTFDFGPVEYHAVHERDAHVTNRGRVGFEVRVQVPPQYERNVSVRPARLWVDPGSTQRLHIRFAPRRPLSVRAQFQLFVGPFEPRTVSVTGTGTCALVTAATLPGAVPDLRAALVQALDQHDRTTTFGPIEAVRAQASLQTCVADLGDVIRGTSRKMSFEVTNVGDLAVTLDVDKSATGSAALLRLDPARIATLAPSQSAKYTVSYLGGATRKSEILGAVRTMIHVALSGRGVLGPPLTLEVRAQVTVPDLTLSADAIDFGNVFIGYRARRYVRITNTTRVQCDWSLTAKSKVFSVTPKSGILAPGAQVDLAVTFTPGNVREQTVLAPITIKSNSRTDCGLRLRGRGQQVRVRFDPSQVEFGTVAVVPAPEGQSPPPPATSPAVPPRPVQIVNDTDMDIELFSVDFDAQYLIDEEQERTFGKFDGSGEMEIEPPVPGAAIAELCPTVDPVADPAAPPPPRPWRQVVVLGTVPPDSPGLIESVAVQHGLVVVNIDTVVDHYAQTQLDAKLVAAEKRKKRAEAEAAPTSIGLAIAVQDAMASGQAAYVTPDLLQKLVTDYCHTRDQPALAPGQYATGAGVLFDVTRCKVVVGGPRAAYGAVAAVMARVPEGRPVKTYVIGLGVLDPEAAAVFAVEPALDVTKRIRADRQAIVYDAEHGGVDGRGEGAELLLDRIGQALLDEMDQHERNAVRARIPPPQLFRILRRPAPRTHPAPTAFQLTEFTKTRWVIPAKSQVTIQIQLAAAASAPCQAELMFELAHERSRRFILPCSVTAGSPDPCQVQTNPPKCQ